jgi:hypothetical protein
VDDVQTEAIRTAKSARAGDQNALDTLRAMGVNAGKGNPRALAARKYVSDWILANPVAGASPVSSMGAEASETCGRLMMCPAWEAPSWLSGLDRSGGDQALATATIILARRARLTRELVQEMALGLEEEPRKLFWWGVAMCSSDRGPAFALLARQPDAVKGPALAGKAVGTARKIQRVIAGAPISVLDRAAGIEHGE